MGVWLDAEQENVRVSAEIAWIMRRGPDDLPPLHSRLVQLIQAVEARAAELDMLQPHEEN